MEGSSIPPDPTRLADTRAWLAHAHDDLRGAEIHLAALPPLLGDVTFHCQQAVEGTLKGYLTWHDHGFQRRVQRRQVFTSPVESAGTDDA